MCRDRGRSPHSARSTFHRTTCDAWKHLGPPSSKAPTSAIKVLSDPSSSARYVAAGIPSRVAGRLDRAAAAREERDRHGDVHRSGCDRADQRATPWHFGDHLILSQGPSADTVRLTEIPSKHQEKALMSSPEPPVAPARPPAQSTNGIALAALIVGIIAFVLAVIPFVIVIAWIPAVVAIVLGIIGFIKRDRPRRGFALAGLVLGVAAIIVGIISTALVAGAVGHAVSDAVSSAAVEVSKSAAPEVASSTPASTTAVTVAVPDVTGKMGDVAKAQITGAGFAVKFATTDGQVVLLASNWEVVSTNPVAGSKLAPGSEVTLVVKRPGSTPTPSATAAATDVVFKVWGTAPSGADITYGSDSSNLSGKVGKTYKLKLKDDALYYAVTAQLQGGGHIHCSVTIDGKTKSGEASGGYNICSAQLNSTFTGWN